jgi:acid phosphatase class B
MVLKDVRAKVEQGWTTTKKVLAALSAWSLVYLGVSTARLGVAFSYDGALVDSTAAFAKAAHEAQPASGPSYWTVVNTSYDLENTKLLPYTLAWLCRGLGFKITILAGRPATSGDALKKEWRHLSPRGFVFSPEPENEHIQLQDGRYVLFFGGSDLEIQEARKAKVYPVRVKRARGAAGAEGYHPGSLGELVLPLSEYSA